jgi:PncC family amidohydrolase
VTDDRLVALAERLFTVCVDRGLTVATAESCTGGLVGARLTAVEGSSEAFVGGVVAYSNAVKESQLGVPSDLIQRFGAVSAEVAEAMARGARLRLGADVALAVTGVAGPGGGSPEKPIGLVFLHVEGHDGGHPLRLDLPGDRERIRGRATAFVLHVLRDVLSRSGDASA